MKARDVLNVWTGWDSPDIFQVDEVAEDGRIVSSKEMTGLDFLNSPMADFEVRNFGSFGKGTDGKWRHYMIVAATQPC